MYVCNKLLHKKELWFFRGCRGSQSVPPTNHSVTVGATMTHVFTPINTKGYEATEEITPVIHKGNFCIKRPPSIIQEKTKFTAVSYVSIIL